MLSFPQLFGTANVTGARLWCVKWGWPLVWALGPNDPSASQMFHGGGGGSATYAVDADDRMLDPVVLSAIHAGKNLTHAVSCKIGLSHCHPCLAFHHAWFHHTCF